MKSERGTCCLFLIFIYYNLFAQRNLEFIDDEM